MIVRIANRILMGALPKEQASETIRDDLAEEHRRRREVRPGAVHDLWYLWEAMKLAGHFVLLWFDSRSSGAPREALGTRSTRRLLKGEVMFVESWIRDVRFGLRSLLRTPSFTALALITIALGVGANAAIFSVVNGVLIKPLPYPDSDRIVVIKETNSWSPITNWVNPEDYLDWREQNRSLDLIGMYRWKGLTYTGGDHPLRVTAEFVTEDVLPILSAELSLGRTFLPDEHMEQQAVVALVSHSFWKRALGADLTVLGSSITLDGKSYTIVGVLGEGWRPLENAGTDIVIPWKFSKQPERGGGNWVRAIARRKAGVDIDAVQADLSSVAAVLSVEFPERNGDVGVLVMSAHDTLFGTSRPQLLMFLASAGLVLIIACVNVANMSFARSVARTREIGVRTALGAGRARIIRQLLVESLMLSCIGGLLGALLSFVSLGVFVARWPAQLLPHMEQIGVDGTVLIFTVGVSVVSGLVFGILPAMTLLRSGSQHCLLRGSTRVAKSTMKRIVHDGLIVAEVCLAMVLLVGSGLLLRSLWALEDENPGFEKENRLVFSVPLLDNDYPTPVDLFEYADLATERLSSMPGVVSVAATPSLPIRGGWDSGTWSLDLGETSAEPSEQHAVHLYRVTTEYLETLGIPLTMGRDFLPTDDRRGQHVALVSESFVRTHFPSENPLGKQIRVSHGTDIPWAEIVGVVGDMQHRGLGEDALPQVYEPLDQRDRTTPTLVLVVRLSSRPDDQLVDAIRAELAVLDPDQPMIDVQTLEELIADQTALHRFRATLMGGFAIASLLLAVVGIYGVLSFVVAQRTWEIGVRMALGATCNSVLSLIIRRGASLVFVGVTGGIAVAFVFSQILESMLFEVSAHDLWVFIGVPALVMTSALVAMLVPARRAALLDPVRTLTQG